MLGISTQGSPRMDAYQPRFSRNSLNLLMAATLGLIVLFNLPQILENRAQITLPKPPPLTINHWRTDSGAQVWFSPFMSAEKVHVHIWYRAGTQFDEAGEAYVLSGLLQHQAQQQDLAVRIDYDTDFIKIEAKLDPSSQALPSQLKRLQSLLYHPELPTEQLAQLRKQLLPSASDQLKNHLYQDRTAIDPERLAGLSRAEVQRFHHEYLHPSRAHVAIVADVPSNTAQVIVERLLPPSVHAAATTPQGKPLTPNMVQWQTWVMMNWPALDDTTTDADMMMTTALLQQKLGKGVQWQPGLSNSSIQLQANRESLEDLWDDKSVLTTKRQLAVQWLRQTQAPDSLSQHLIELNAYGLPQDYLAKQIVRLEDFDRRRWQHILQTLLAPLMTDVASSSHN